MNRQMLEWLLFAALLAALLPALQCVAQEKSAAAASSAAPQKAAPKGEATINLSTTVTGNQEQPRVLYILPWKSPASGNIEFEGLLTQQSDVFGHVEREELRRSLEAEAALQHAAPVAAEAPAAAP